MKSRVVHFWRLHGVPVLRQLQLEEALLRADDRNWCVINSDVEQPTAVLGISGKLEQMLDTQQIAEQGLTVIRRFSGGGTVIIDKNTLLVTLIFRKDALPDVQPYPRPIMEWTGSLYKPVFAALGDFQLRDNDYTFGDLKFGGNAQSIIKDRWLHHTSFLWDIDHTLMQTLKQPSRQPEYRQNRSHRDFLCTLKERMKSKEAFPQLVEEALKQQGFTVKMNQNSISNFHSRTHIKTTTIIPTSCPGQS